MSLDGFNKTHCDKCNEKVERGEGIYADRGFYHKDPCYKQIKQKYIDDYEWDEHKTSYEIEMVCPHCGYVERDSWELTDDDGDNTCGQCDSEYELSLIHISEPTRLGMISYAVFCLKKKKTQNVNTLSRLIN